MWLHHEHTGCAHSLPHHPTTLSHPASLSEPHINTSDIPVFIENESTACGTSRTVWGTPLQCKRRPWNWHIGHRGGRHVSLVIYHLYDRDLRASPQCGLFWRLEHTWLHAVQRQSTRLLTNMYLIYMYIPIVRFISFFSSFLLGMTSRVDMDLIHARKSTL